MAPRPPNPNRPTGASTSAGNQGGATKNRKDGVLIICVIGGILFIVGGIIWLTHLFKIPSTKFAFDSFSVAHFVASFFIFIGFSNCLGVAARIIREKRERSNVYSKISGFSSKGRVLCICGVLLIVPWTVAMFASVPFRIVIILFIASVHISLVLFITWFIFRPIELVVSNDQEQQFYPNCQQPRQTALSRSMPDNNDRPSHFPPFSHHCSGKHHSLFTNFQPVDTTTTPHGKHTYTHRSDRYLNQQSPVGLGNDLYDLDPTTSSMYPFHARSTPSPSNKPPPAQLCRETRSQIPSSLGIPRHLTNPLPPPRINYAYSRQYPFKPTASHNPNSAKELGKRHGRYRRLESSESDSFSGESDEGNTPL